MPRAPTVLAAALVCAALVSCAGGGGDDHRRHPLNSGVLRTADALEARGVLERFLHSLAAGDFPLAAEDFSGDLKPLRDLIPSVAPDDAAELLEKYCTQQRGACLPARVTGGRALSRDSFEFDLELLESGEPVAVGDPLIPQSRRTSIVFRVQRIGTRFYVLDLPPRRL
jgi:hypothetical protein